MSEGVLADSEFSNVQQLWEEICAFDFGYDAYKNGKLRTDNPYLNHLMHIEAWYEGYDYAKNENTFH